MNMYNSCITFCLLLTYCLRPAWRRGEPSDTGNNRVSRLLWSTQSQAYFHSYQENELCLFPANSVSGRHVDLWDTSDEHTEVCLFIDTNYDQSQQQKQCVCHIEGIPKHLVTDKYLAGRNQTYSLSVWSLELGQLSRLLPELFPRLGQLEYYYQCLNSSQQVLHFHRKENRSDFRTSEESRYSIPFLTTL